MIVLRIRNRKWLWLTLITIAICCVFSFYLNLKNKKSYFLLTYSGKEFCEIVEGYSGTVRSLDSKFCHFLSDGTLIKGNGDLEHLTKSGQLMHRFLIPFDHDLDVDEKNKKMFAITYKTYFRNKTEHMINKIVGYSLIDGNQVFDWQIQDHIDEFKKMAGVNIHEKLAESVELGTNIKKFFYKTTHFNSLQILQQIKHKKIPYTDGDLLVGCVRNKMFFIISHITGKVIWVHKLSDIHSISPHSVRMLDNGNILFLTNKNKYTSRVNFVELDPSTNEIVWSYDGDKEFVSDFMSSVFFTENGTYLFAISNTGLVGEVDKTKKVLWTWRQESFKEKSYIYRAQPLTTDFAEDILEKYKN